MICYSSNRKVIQSLLSLLIANLCHEELGPPECIPWTYNAKFPFSERRMVSWYSFNPRNISLTNFSSSSSRNLQIPHINSFSLRKTTVQKCKNVQVLEMLLGSNSLRNSPDFLKWSNISSQLHSFKLITYVVL